MRAKCAYYWQKMRLTYLSHFITRQSNFFVPAFFCGKMRGQSVSVRSKVNRFKISSVQGASLFIYIGSHLALEKKAEKNIVKNLHVSKMCSTFALAIER